jgi:hypothetical protein
VDVFDSSCNREYLLFERDPFTTVLLAEWRMDGGFSNGIFYVAQGDKGVIASALMGSVLGRLVSNESLSQYSSRTRCPKLTRLGRAMHKPSQVGPLITRQYLNKVRGYLRLGN